jgi:hypothetical protein
MKNRIPICFVRKSCMKSYGDLYTDSCRRPLSLVGESQQQREGGQSDRSWQNLNGGLKLLFPIFLRATKWTGQVYSSYARCIRWMSIMVSSALPLPRAPCSIQYGQRRKIKINIKSFEQQLVKISAAKC